MAEVIFSGREARELKAAINKCKDKPTTVTFDTKGNIIFDCQPLYPKRKYEILGLKPPPERITISTCQVESGHTLTPPEEGVMCIRSDWFNVPETMKVCNILPKDISSFLMEADKVELRPVEGQLEASFSRGDVPTVKVTMGEKCPEQRLLRTMGGIVEIPLPPEEAGEP